MTSTAAFCHNCGNQMGPSSQFCDRCGAPVGAPAPPPASAPAPGSGPAPQATVPIAPPPASPYVAPGYMPPPPGYGQLPQVVQTTNGLSVASLVLGIVWVFGIGSILAVIFGFIGRKQIKESAGRQSGDGMALAGIILGFVGVAGLILWIVLVVAVTTTINNCFDNTPTNSNSATCGTNTGTGNSGGLFNSGSTGNSAAPLDHGGAPHAGTVANRATGQGFNVSLLR
jgi:hypothetical protein